MKKVTSKIIPGIGSDYQFQFCRIDDEGHLEFGVEENFNEYITLCYKDKDYYPKCSDKLNNIQQYDLEFYNKITDMILENII